MNAQDFCFWLQGHFELVENQDHLSIKQVQVIKAHLNLVFEQQTQVDHGQITNTSPATFIC